MEVEVKHDAANNQFLAQVEGKDCFLKYRMLSEFKVEFSYTYVPYELRGRGIAARIVTEAFKYAIDNKLIVIPACTYVWNFLDRHTEYNYIIGEY